MLLSAADGENAAYVFNYNFIEAGTYKITIAEKSFVIYNNAPAASSKARAAAAEPQFTKAMTYSFGVAQGETTGIAGVQVAQEYVVYGLSGNLVLRTADASALRSLPAGFYIINGRKALVRP